MRIRHISEFNLNSKKLIIFDPMCLYEYKENTYEYDTPSDAIVVDTIIGDGSFSVYQNNDYLVIDTAPRQFKAKSRAEFTKLENEVYVDTGSICFAAFTDERKNQIEDTMENGYVVADFSTSQFKLWVEEKDEIDSFNRTIICIGPEQKLYLHGENASKIQEIEKEVARALQMKGPEQKEILEKLKERILKLHLDGNKDNRLEMIASSLSLNMPRRPRKKNNKNVSRDATHP